MSNDPPFGWGAVARPRTATLHRQPWLLSSARADYLNPLASESLRWEEGLVASVVSWSGTSLWTFILSWWGLFVVGAMDTTRPQDLKGQTSEGRGVERTRGCPCDPRLPASLSGLLSPAAPAPGPPGELRPSTCAQADTQIFRSPRAQPASDQSHGAGRGQGYTLGSRDLPEDFSCMAFSE